jgi:alpha,alpha-trehalase
MTAVRRAPRLAMRALLAMAALLATSAVRAVAIDPEPPDVVFKDLFVAVQMQAIFQDGKAFPDATPRSAPQDILAQYHRLHPNSPDALRSFIDAHFSLPESAGVSPSAPEQVPILRHIDALWDPLTRNTSTAARYSSLLPLPHAYVVPGGRFREIYYWDSYFTMLGLEESDRHDLVDSMVRDFAYLIDTYGHVPNGTRSYYLSRSQPPFFFEMVALFSAKDPAAAYARYLPQLQREYAFWMDGQGTLSPGKAHRRVVAMPDGSILNRYWDDRDTARDESYREDTDLARQSGRPASQILRDLRAAAESGWDFGSRWFADGRTRASIDTTQIVPIDLNSMLYGLESAIRLGCKRRADRACAREFERRAKSRAAAIDRYLWDEQAGAYYDYHWSEPAAAITRLSAATLYPLFVGLASDSQAQALAKTITRDLLKPGGVVTSPVTTGEQWDAPNGWAPIQWMAVDGLRRYGQNLLAERIACRWMVNVGDLYRQTGKLVEKYDVINVGQSGGGGEYATQDGFGWTNGVMRKLAAVYPADLGRTAVEQCR